MHYYKNMSRRLIISSGIIILIVIVGGILLTRASVLAAPEQPVPFSHKTHVWKLLVLRLLASLL